MGLFGGIGLATGRPLGQARDYPAGADHAGHVLAPAHEHEVSVGAELSPLAVDGLLRPANVVFERQPPSGRVDVRCPSVKMA